MAHGRGKARRLTYDGGRAGMVRLSLYPSMSRLFGVNNVHRSPFTVHRSPFTVHRSAFRRRKETVFRSEPTASAESRLYRGLRPTQIGAWLKSCQGSQID